LQGKPVAEPLRSVECESAAFAWCLAFYCESAAFAKSPFTLGALCAIMVVELSGAVGRRPLAPERFNATKGEL